MIRNAKGFTLIELMIVVAIIGILAAIAIPNFLAMQLRAKRAELPSNLDGIRTAQKAYHAEWDSFTTCADTPGTVQRAQVDFLAAGATGDPFQLLGWVADGKVRGSYATTNTASGGSAADDDFTAVGRSDVDGDGVEASYACNRAEKSSMVSANDVY